MAEPRSDISYTRRVVIAVVVTLIALAIALLLWYGIKVLLLGFAGVLLAVMLRSLAVGLHKLTRLPVGWSLGVTVVALVGLFVGVGMLVWPSLVSQAVELRKKLPEAWAKLEAKVQQQPWGKQLLDTASSLNPWDESKQGKGGSEVPEQVIRRGTTFLTSAFNVVAYLVIVVFLGIYLAAQPRLYMTGLSVLFPPPWRGRVCEILGECGVTLRWWLIAQVVDMVLIGVATAVGLWLIGVPLALTLGLLAAIFNFIPNFGPFISFLPAVLLALVDDPQKALYVTIFYVVLQGIEGYLLLPLLQKGAVDAPPALLIAVQVLLALLAGALGLALAAPLLACFLIVTKMAYLHDAMGDTVELTDGKERGHGNAAPARRGAT
ncbi:MAG TPA: AI-2E family transporter [Tepidisphaeraceae bacterium]|nr:AI-2E family transporter [Tepidisphaeraceae bacterium]